VRARTTNRRSGRAVSGATVTLGGARGRSGRRGYVRLRPCLRRAGLHTARARHAGYRPARARVRAVRAGPGRFTG
jgi:hypothetical protein